MPKRLVGRTQKYDTTHSEEAPIISIYGYTRFRQLPESSFEIYEQTHKQTNKQTNKHPYSINIHD